jgi:hypothetical protein
LSGIAQQLLLGLHLQKHRITLLVIWLLRVVAAAQVALQALDRAEVAVPEGL